MTRVLFAYRDDVDLDGGAAGVMRATAGALRARGVEVDISVEVRPDVRGYDVVHVWNIWRPDTALEQLRHLRAQDAVVIWQPFYLDWMEYTWARAVIPAVLGSDRPEHERADLLDGIAEGRLAVESMTKFTPNEAVPGLHAVITEMAGLADHVCVCSTREIQRLAQLTRAHGLRFTVTPHGVDADRFAAPDPAAFAGRFGTRDFVLCVGSVDGRKNQLMLAEALRGTGLELVLVGPCYEPEYLEIVRARAERLLWTDRVEPDLVRSAYGAAAAHALPSFAEGSALASMEAAAAGLPVVVGNRTSEFEYYGDLAFYADPTDVGSIRQAVLAAVESGADRRRLLQEHLRTHPWSRSAETTLAAYDRALAARAARDRAALGLGEARERVVVAFSDELVRRPDLLDRFRAGPVTDVTLAIWTGGLDEAAQARLVEAVDRAGLGDDERADLVALPALTAEQDRALAALAEGVLSDAGAPAPFDACGAWTP